MDYAIPPKVQRAVAALHHNPAVCTPELRQAVSAYAAALSLDSVTLPQIPEAVAPFVVKATLHAYQITDGDLQILQAAGYTDDAIFEITLCASIGAGLARFERGLAALQGGA